MIDEEKNIRLTVVRPESEEADELTIDLYAIFDFAKRLFALWLALAIGVGSLAGAIGLLRQRSTAEQGAEALIRYADEDVDATKISSSNVIKEALLSLNLDVQQEDTIQRCMTVKGVLPSDVYDRQVLYNKLIAKGVDMDTVDALLEENYQSTSYVVSFDYVRAGYKREEGVEILNAILNAYWQYYDDTYMTRDLLGNSAAVIDYQDYDYAEVVNILSSSLDETLRFISKVSADDKTGFRSSKTGFSFTDLTRIATMLQDIELDRVSSYITVNHVTKYDENTMIRHYEWLIEELQRQRAVQEAQLAALSDSIASYEKDPIIFSMSEGDSAQANSGDVNAYYDSMIRQKLNTQRVISDYNRTCSYYQSVIDGFSEESAAPAGSAEKAEEYLNQMGEKRNWLIDTVAETTEEFYSTARYSGSLQMLVPPTADTPSMISKETLKLVGITEAVLLVLYLGAAAVLGIKQANPKKEKKV